MPGCNNRRGPKGPATAESYAEESLQAAGRADERRQAIHDGLPRDPEKYREATGKFFDSVMAPDSLAGGIIKAYSSDRRSAMNTPADEALERTRRVHRHH